MGKVSRLVQAYVAPQGKPQILLESLFPWDLPKSSRLPWDLTRMAGHAWFLRLRGHADEILMKTTRVNPSEFWTSHQLASSSRRHESVPDFEHVQERMCYQMIMNILGGEVATTFLLNIPSSKDVKWNNTEVLEIAFFHHSRTFLMWNKRIQI